MTVDPRDVVRPPDAVLLRSLGDELVLLDLTTEHYFTLDDVGARMWQALVEEPNVGAAAERLLEEYEVDRGQLESDLAAFTGDLIERGLLERRDGGR